MLSVTKRVIPRRKERARPRLLLLWSAMTRTMQQRAAHSAHVHPTQRQRQGQMDLRTQLWSHPPKSQRRMYKHLKPTVPRRSPVLLQVMIRQSQRTIGKKPVPLQRQQQQQQHPRTAPLLSRPLRLSLHQHYSIHPLAQLPSSGCTTRHLSLLLVRSASCISTARAC